MYWDKLDELTQELDTLTEVTGSIGYPIRVCDEVQSELNGPYLVTYHEQGVTESDMRTTLSRAKLFIENAQVDSDFYREQIVRINGKLEEAEAAINDYFRSTVHAGTTSSGSAGNSSQTSGTGDTSSGAEQSGNSESTQQ